MSSSPQIVLFRTGSASGFLRRYQMGARGRWEGRSNLRRRHLALRLVSDVCCGKLKDAKERCRNGFEPPRAFAGHAPV